MVCKALRFYYQFLHHFEEPVGHTKRKLLHFEILAFCKLYNKTLIIVIVFSSKDRLDSRNFLSYGDRVLRLHSP